MVIGLPNEISLWQIEEIISSWRSMPQLAEFAAVRQGFCNSDGGHGLQYPEDLDEYEREVEKIAIPDGHVLLFGRKNFPNESAGFEFKISETLYLTIPQWANCRPLSTPGVQFINTFPQTCRRSSHVKNFRRERNQVGAFAHRCGLANQEVRGAGRVFRRRGRYCGPKLCGMRGWQKACAESYREFASNAAVIDYSESEHKLREWQDTAVYTFSWQMTYAREQGPKRESGTDQLVLGRHGTDWRVLFRYIYFTPSI